jgi:hypothetical protein
MNLRKRAEHEPGHGVPHLVHQHAHESHGRPGECPPRLAGTQAHADDERTEEEGGKDGDGNRTDPKPDDAAVGGHAPRHGRLLVQQLRARESPDAMAMAAAS